MTTLKIATYNIHKGFSHFNRRMVLHELREKLRGLDADIVFLQEVQGEHGSHASRHADYPAAPQHEFLADEFWAHHAYGMNAMYEAGHHGNAILSRFPILQTRNKDVSAHRFEQRGLLHCEIDLNGQSIEREGGGKNPYLNPPPKGEDAIALFPSGEKLDRGLAAGYPPAHPLRVHCFCVHFGLFGKGRRAQMQALIAHVQNEVPADAPLVIAGDFNDWRNQLSRELASELDVYDVFHLGHGKPARSFPASFPLFKLDRIYVRGFDVVECHVHGGRRMSDHAALLAQLKRT